jgi:hypothetical protein
MLSLSPAVPAAADPSIPSPPLKPAWWTCERGRQKAELSFVTRLLNL